MSGALRQVAHASRNTSAFSSYQSLPCHMLTCIAGMLGREPLRPAPHDPGGGLTAAGTGPGAGSGSCKAPGTRLLLHHQLSRGALALGPAASRGVCCHCGCSRVISALLQAPSSCVVTLQRMVGGNLALGPCMSLLCLPVCVATTALSCCGLPHLCKCQAAASNVRGMFGCAFQQLGFCVLWLAAGVRTA
jgi:hypothetical protein